MTNEEIVLKRLSKRGRSPLRFGGVNGISENITNMINHLKNKKSVYDRVYEILRLSRYLQTYDSHNKFQCYGSARRSAQDIWRIYKYYFGDIDIFAIMRVLYYLVHEENLSCTRCCTINKLVFYFENYKLVQENLKGDLGVPLKFWKNIGLSLENK